MGLYFTFSSAQIGWLFNHSTNFSSFQALGQGALIKIGLVLPNPSILCHSISFSYSNVLFGLISAEASVLQGYSLVSSNSLPSPCIMEPLAQKNQNSDGFVLFRKIDHLSGDHHGYNLVRPCAYTEITILRCITFVTLRLISVLLLDEFEDKVEDRKNSDMAVSSPGRRDNVPVVQLMLDTTTTLDYSYSAISAITSPHPGTRVHLPHQDGS